MQSALLQKFPESLELTLTRFNNRLKQAFKSPTSNISAAEIKRLNKALAQAELERDLLKKAAVYFTNDYLFDFN